MVRFASGSQVAPFGAAWLSKDSATLSTRWPAISRRRLEVVNLGLEVVEQLPHPPVVVSDLDRHLRQPLRRRPPPGVGNHAVGLPVRAAKPIRGARAGDDLTRPLVDPYLLVNRLERALAVANTQPATTHLLRRERPDPAAAVPAVRRVVRRPDEVVVVEHHAVHRGVAGPHAAVVPGVVLPNGRLSALATCWR